jgi:hypothetical protein
MEPLNRKILFDTHAALINQNVAYGYGAKSEGGADPRDGHHWNPDSTGKLSTPIESIENIDCSGLIRYLVYRASDGDTRWPDGSQDQLAWCRVNLQKCSYNDCANQDNILRIAFMSPGVNGVGNIGHVWLIFNGNTLESYGGHGVGSHKWSVYADRVSGCFEVPSVPGVATVPVAPAKKPALLKLALKQKDGSLTYYTVKSAQPDNGSFTVDKSEVVTALMGGSGRVPIRSLLSTLGVPIYTEGNHLDDPDNPVMYLFVDTK